MFQSKFFIIELFIRLIDKQFDHCETINGDGKLLEIKTEYLGDKRYSSVADKDGVKKMQFWITVANSDECKNECIYQVIVSVSF